MYNTLAYLVNERSLKQTNKIRQLNFNINETERDRERKENIFQLRLTAKFSKKKLFAHKKKFGDKKCAKQNIYQKLI